MHSSASRARIFVIVSLFALRPPLLLYVGARPMVPAGSHRGSTGLSAALMHQNALIMQNATVILGAA